MSVEILEELALAGRSPGDAVFPAMRMSALRAGFDTVATWIARNGHRRALRELAEEERLLRDVGITLEQALREADKPFWRQ